MTAIAHPHIQPRPAIARAMSFALVVASSCAIVPDLALYSELAEIPALEPGGLPTPQRSL